LGLLACRLIPRVRSRRGRRRASVPAAAGPAVRALASLERVRGGRGVGGPCSSSASCVDVRGKAQHSCDFLCTCAVPAYVSACMFRQHQSQYAERTGTCQAQPRRAHDMDGGRINAARTGGTQGTAARRRRGTSRAMALADQTPKQRAAHRTLQSGEGTHLCKVRWLYSYSPLLPAAVHETRLQGVATARR